MVERGEGGGFAVGGARLVARVPHTHLFCWGGENSTYFESCSFFCMEEAKQPHVGDNDATKTRTRNITTATERAPTGGRST